MIEVRLIDLASVLRLKHVRAEKVRARDVRAHSRTSESCIYIDTSKVTVGSVVG